MCQIMLGNASLLCNNIVYDSLFFLTLFVLAQNTLLQKCSAFYCFLSLYFFKQDRSFLNKDISFLERLSFTLKKMLINGEPKRLKTLVSLTTGEMLYTLQQHFIESPYILKNIMYTTDLVWKNFRNSIHRLNAPS